jgi:hypothetical protein
MEFFCAGYFDHGVNRHAKNCQKPLILNYGVSINLTLAGTHSWRRNLS